MTAERRDLLVAWALDCGFDRAGVATLEPSRHGDALEEWIARGDHAQMGYLERRVEVRLDASKLLEGARSALCVAQHYSPPAQPNELNDLWSGVARYARGRDYHDTMTPRLRELGERIEAAFPGVRTRTYVDTGPVLERELAERAGLGWVGKNTMLLDRSSSWFLLGEILMTLDVEPSDPLADLCGQCTRCLDACPTGALPEPYRLDSRRCISYWTIEHRGAIPMSVREELGEWVFGCDVCQEVCPWNHKTDAVRAEDFELQDQRGSLDLAGLLTLSRDEYVERFRGSPLKRSKLQGLRRNACVSAGNRGDARLVPSLLELLTTGEVVERGHAAWALGRIGGSDARSALERALEVECDASVLPEIESALRALETPPSGDSLESSNSP